MADIKYTSVNKELLQQAFAMAHRAGEDPNVKKDDRDKFRAIASLIWRAHGEPGNNPPKGVGSELANKMGVQL